MHEKLPELLNALVKERNEATDPVTQGFLGHAVSSVVFAMKQEGIPPAPSQPSDVRAELQASEAQRLPGDSTQ